MTLLLALLALPAIAAEPTPAITARLDARVNADLQTIVGTLHLTGPDGVVLEDTLSRLPVPTDDIQVRRTFPWAVERGHIRLLALPPESNSRAFITVLPRRYDASGLVPGDGLFANGLWHPQPTWHGSIPVVHWTVELDLPPGTVGVLNGAVGSGHLSWQGDADRLALAVVPHGRVDHLPLPEGELTVVTHGPRHRRRERLLAQILATAWPGPEASTLVVVDTPSLRRLARPGPDVLFLSEHAFRVTSGLWHYHQGAVRRGMLRAALPIADPWLRSFVADALDRSALPDPSPKKILSWLSWIPQIDDLLYDGSLPFYSEVFGDLWSSDPVADDLSEVVDPHSPGRVVAHRLDDRYGAGTSLQVARAVLDGASFDAALAQAGVARADLEALRQPPPDQDLRVDVHRDGDQHIVEITRQAADDAPVEPVDVEIDGHVQTWLAGPGPDTLVQRLDYRPHHVVVNPDGVVDEHPSFDRWPRHWTWTASFFPAELALRDKRISAYADLALRKQYDTRWIFDLGLATNPEDLVRAEAGFIHYRGPLLNRRSRPVRLWAIAGPALLDPAFRPTQGAAVALGGTVGASWETRVDPDLPMRGHRLWSTADGGFVPGTTRAWGAFRAGALGVLPLDGRVALAGRLTGGLATGDVAHRLLTLGGSSGVRGLPVASLVGDRAASSSLDLRWQAVRNASVPLWLAWISQVQLSGGIDAGLLHDADPSVARTWRAVGWSAGLDLTFDLLGVRPTTLGLTAGDLIAVSPEDPAPDRWPELYLRASAAF